MFLPLSCSFFLPTTALKDDLYHTIINVLIFKPILCRLLLKPRRREKSVTNSEKANVYKGKWINELWYFVFKHMNTILTKAKGREGEEEGKGKESQCV